MDYTYSGVQVRNSSSHDFLVPMFANFGEIWLKIGEIWLNSSSRKIPGLMNYSYPL